MMLPSFRPSRNTIAYFLLSALGAGIMGAGLVGLLLADIARQRSETLERTREGAIFKARLMGDHAARTLEGVDLILFSLSNDLALANGLPPGDQARPRLRERLLFLPQAGNLALYDAKGSLVADAKRLDAKEEVQDKPFFTRHAKDGVLFHLEGPMPRRHDETGRKALRLSRMITQPNGRFMGVLLAEIDPGFFSAFYREEDPAGNDIVALIDGTGRIMTSEVPQLLAPGNDVAESGLFDRSILARMPPGGLQSHEDQRWLFVLNQLSNFPLRVVVAESKDKALAPWRKAERETRYVILGIIFTYLGALAIIGFVLRRRQMAEDALTASEAHLRAIHDNADIGIVRTDKNGGITALNPAFAEMMGAPGDALIGRNLLELTHPDDRDAAQTRFFEMRKGSYDRYRLEKRFRKLNDGRTVWARVSTVTVNPNRPAPLTFAMIEDITESKRAKDTIEALLKRSQLLLSAVGEGILGVDSHGRVAFVNPAAETLLGYAAKEMIGQSSHQLVHARLPDGSEHAESDCPIKAVLSDGRPRQIPFDAFWSKSGDMIPVEFIVTPMMSESGIEGAVVAFRDISRRLEAENEIKRSNAELEQFGYAVSHDLQEPLRMVASYVQLLGRRYQGKLDEDADTFIGFAVDGAKRMQQMITDLLEYSRVQRKGNPMAPVALGESLRSAMQNLDLAVQECQGKILVETELPTVSADAAQMARLFQNLIGNALKYRDKQRPPAIKISARVVGGMATIGIQDNGIGIDPQYFERIFQIFQRLHARTEYPGTGVGLALCRKIVERHGGKIWVESTPGQGSTFYFQLPLVEQAP